MDDVYLITSPPCRLCTFVVAVLAWQYRTACTLAVLCRFFCASKRLRCATLRALGQHLVASQLRSLRLVTSSFGLHTQGQHSVAAASLASTRHLQNWVAYTWAAMCRFAAVLYCAHLGSIISLRSFALVGSSLAVLACVRFGSNVSFRSFIRLGSSVAMLDVWHLRGSLWQYWAALCRLAASLASARH